MRRVAPWCVGAVLALGSVAGAQAATFELQIADDPGEGFNDATPFTPVGGNDATTLGQARRNVFNRAGQILGARLQSSVTIVVQATFNPSECSPNSGNLGSAGAAGLFRDFPGAPRAGVFYPAALANAFRGSDISAETPDISANFNSNVDSDPNCLGGGKFYYGFDHNADGFTDDLINTVLHELIHGLGFASGIDESSGANPNEGFFNIFDLFVFDETLGAFWNTMSDAQRQTSAKSAGSLVWNGAAVNGVAAALNSGLSNGGRVRLFAPDPVQPGSSVSHWDTEASPNLMMEPFSTTDIRGTEGVDFSICMLQDIGWPLLPGTRCPDSTTLNNAPVANGQDVQTAEDNGVAITLTGSDPNNDPLTFSIVSSPTLGALSGTAPNLVYTPNANANGSDSFTFRVTDDRLANSTPAIVNISLAPVNDAPIADAQSVSTGQGQALAITLTGSDVDGQALSFTVLSNPANGTLSGTAPNLSYTPDNGFSGDDSFSFRASDGQADSAPATVSISVVANPPPTANAQSLTTPEDTATAITLSGSDPTGEPISFTVVSQPTKGALSGTPPDLTYTPNANANGADSFTFRVNDGTSDSAPATVAIDITPVNDAPLANAQSLTLAEDTAQAITLSGSDVDGDALAFTVVTPPTRGALTGTPPNLTYTPQTNANGADSFSFRVNDGSVDSAPATVSLNVTAVNDAPVGNPQSLSVAEDGALAVVLSGMDAEGDSLSFNVVSPPTHGIVSGTSPNLTYTPRANFNGSDSFAFVASDGSAASAPATVSITVTPVNDAPVADSQAVSTMRDTPRALVLSGSDVDGQALSFSVIAPPANGALSGTPPNLTYTPGAGFVGSDSFTFRASDGSLDSNPATVSITIAAGNTAPIANAQTVSVPEDGSTAIVLSGSDPDGNAISFTVLTQPTHGSLSGTAPNLSYAPQGNFNGSDSFSFKVNDGAADSAAATVSIDVTPVNDAPVAHPLSRQTGFETAVAVTLSGSDADGDALSFALAMQPANGTLSGTPPNLSYTPDAGFVGSDSFTFRVNDGIADSAAATVSLSVLAASGTSASVNDDSGRPVSLQSSIGALQNVRREALPSALPGGQQSALGFLIGFDIAGLPAGGATTVTLTLPAGVSATNYLKFGPEPGNAAAHFFDFAFNGTTGATVNGATVTLRLVDGGRGDADGLANGRIVDPGTPVIGNVNISAEGGGAMALRWPLLLLALFGLARRRPRRD